MRETIFSISLAFLVAYPASSATFRWESSNLTNEVKVKSAGTTIDSSGKINLATGKFHSGEIVFRFNLKAPFSTGKIIIPWLYLTNTPKSFDISISLDGEKFESVIPKNFKPQAYKTITNLTFELPRKKLIGYSDWFLRIYAWESSGKEQAATLGKLIVNCSIDPNLKERKIKRWCVYHVHPWVEADAKQLPVLLTKKITHINLSGPRNDWLTGACAIGSDEKSEVIVKLSSPKRLANRIELRVVGQVRNPENPKQIVWDPLIRRIDIPKAEPVLNYNQIKHFPRFTILPDSPIFLWITVDLRHIKSGNYQAKLSFRDDFGNKEEIPLNINVLNAEIPIDSPLYYIAWQWWSGKTMIRDFIEHGINVAWTNHEQAWKLGAKFLLFCHHHPVKLPDESTKKKYLEWTAERIKLIEKLKVPPNQWAFNPFDEPSDKTAKIVLEYGKLIKKHFPKAQLWYDPAWGKLADSNQNCTTTNGCLKIINPIVDIWCPYSWHLWDGSGAFEYIKSTGKPIWSYDIWGTASRRPSVGREMLRTGPWLAWKYRLKGFGIYAANDWKNNVNVWVGRNGNTFNYSFIYPLGPDGRPISSRGYEAIRQGIQEYKRLYVLKTLGADTKILDMLVDLAISRDGVGRNVEIFDCIRNRLDSMLVEFSN